MTLEELTTEYGESVRAVAEGWLEELVVLTFRENRRGGDPIAHSTDGRAVFPDKYRDGDRILPGESWLCSVARKGDNTFFAAPLARLDESFFRGLMPVERRRVAELMWEQHRDVVLDEVRELLTEEDGSVHAGVAPAMVAELDEVRRERDDLRDRLAELREQFDLAVQRLGNATQAASGGVRDDRGPFHVERVGAELLESEIFEEPFWHGHVSPDRRVIFLKAHPRGPLAAHANRLAVPGLSRFVPREVVSLEARFDPRHGGFFLKMPAA